MLALLGPLALTNGAVFNNNSNETLSDTQFTVSAQAVGVDDDGEIHFRHVTEREGLIDDNVVSLLPDDDGTLWIATRRGLARHDPETGAFVNLHVDDGLPSEQFNPGSAAVGRDRMYFGSPAGLVALERGEAFPETTASPVVLRAVRTLGGPWAMERTPWETERIEVPWGEVLILEFVVLDYGNSTSHRYEYRLSGMRDEWIDLAQNREITFTDLDPGRYSLEIRGRNDQGVWSDGAHAVDLRIVPPFWMTGWFRGLVAAGLMFAAVGAHRVRTSALQRRNRELERLQGERERALAGARASEEKLQVAYGRLRQLTGRLEAAKEEERKRISRELHDEMGQALTAAKINLQLLEAVDDAELRRRRVEDTVGLVDRMIEHVRALSLDLRPPLLDELGLVPALRGFLETQARRSGLQVDARIDESVGQLSPETEILVFRAVQEAVTNVIRHAEARTVEVEVRRREEGIRVRVKDDGQGFDVPRALEKALGGLHLGILGIQERVEAAGGSLRIDSSPGNGTEVDLSVPFPDEGGS